MDQAAEVLQADPFWFMTQWPTNWVILITVVAAAAVLVIVLSTRWSVRRVISTTRNLLDTQSSLIGDARVLTASGVGCVRIVEDAYMIQLLHRNSPDDGDHPIALAVVKQLVDALVGAGIDRELCQIDPTAAQGLTAMNIWRWTHGGDGDIAKIALNFGFAEDKSVPRKPLTRGNLEDLARDRAIADARRNAEAMMFDLQLHPSAVNVISAELGTPSDIFDDDGVVVRTASIRWTFAGSAAENLAVLAPEDSEPVM